MGRRIYTLKRKQKSKHDQHTKIVISQGLNDLRNEEERKINRVLFQHAMGILQNEWVVAVPTFEERDGSDWWNHGPQYEVLIKLGLRYLVGI